MVYLPPCLSQGTKPSRVVSATVSPVRSSAIGTTELTCADLGSKKGETNRTNGV